jgi:hypothetical protein
MKEDSKTKQSPLRKESAPHPEACPAITPELDVEGPFDDPWFLPMFGAGLG